MMAARPRAAASSSSSLGDQPSLILTFIVIDLFLLQMDEPLLSEQFSKTAEGIRALARSERYQEMRRMMLAIAADYDFLAKRAAVVEDMLPSEEPNSGYHTG